MVAELWPPELPPVSISMGMKFVSTMLAAKAPSKEASIPLVNVADIIRNRSQGTRLRQVANTPVFIYGLSDGAIAAIFSISSVASSWITSMASSTVTMPTSRPSASTTGRARKSYLLRALAASSWSVWVLTYFILVSIILRMTSSFFASSKSFTVTIPRSFLLLSVT